MHKVHKLLYMAVLPPFLVTLLVLTSVVFVHDLGRLSELLITHNASVGTIALIGAAILPAIVVFSLPLSFLVGCLIGFSTLAGESQITALRACGVPLRRMLLPVLLLGALVGLGTAALSLLVLPKTNDVLYALKDRVSLRQATSQVRPRVFNEDFPNLVFYVDELALDRQHWSKVFLVDGSNPASPRTVLANAGTWITDSEGSRLQLHLERGTIYEVDPEDPSKDKVSIFGSTDIPIEIQKASSIASGQELSSHTRKPAEMNTAALWQGSASATPEERLEQLLELHRRIALPFSVLPFALLGLTLGVGSQKGGRTSGFVLSMLLVLLFYTLFVNGLRLASVGKLAPWLGAWGANIILALLGLALLTSTERGLALRHYISNWRWWADLSRWGRRMHLDAMRPLMARIDRAILSSTRKLAQVRFPKILDVYVSRGFLVYFLWSILACGTLFVVLTIFDLLDDIIRNKIPVGYVADYFVFLSPHILMLVVPMSVLLAILINFGILEKNAEVTALKAGGWSLYRVAVPIFLLAGVFCVGLYLMQDYVVPYANVRQDALRNVIKGRPAQTSMQPQRKWIFGTSNRIFNYEYFDASQALFVGLNIYEVDLRELFIMRRIHAARASIGSGGTWELENGWVRDFRPGHEGFHNIVKANFDFPEKANYFQKEIFEPKESSKLSYFELRTYINYLKQSGYNATELQIELYKKIAFPLSCVVMALLGLPFSFSTGRKGAFFGIAISVAIAISYWGINSAFEQMGAYGLLVPLLAAWAPNILFGATGLALFFSIRT